MTLSKNNRKNVLVLGYLPPPEEGTAKITEMIVNSKYLNKEFKIELLALYKMGDVNKRGKLSIFNILLAFFNYFRYFYFVIDKNIDLVYMPMAQNTCGFIRDSIFVIFSKMFRKNLCVHFHGGNFKRFYSVSSKLMKNYIQYVLLKYDRLIVLSNNLISQFEGLIENKKISVVYNSVNMPVDVKRTNQHDGKIRVIFIGYLGEAKGAVDLVEAIPSVVEKYNMPIEFIFCGQELVVERNIMNAGRNRCFNHIIRIINTQNLNEYMRITGPIKSDVKWQLLVDSDIFVLPSYSEGMPISVLEAMHCSLPLIVTPVGAMPEILKDGVNCIFVEPGRPDMITEAILELCADYDLRIKMGKNNKKLMDEIYNESNFTKSMSDVWCIS